MALDKPLVDRYGRRVTTLRISLTDRCNFRCVYCMPPEGVTLLPRTGFLTVSELVRFVRVAGRMGVERYRLTGGEPLLRRDIVEVVRSIRRIETVRELSITTNGTRLGELAADLRAAGLDRLNVSLDSLDDARFGEVTRYPDYRRVREGIEAALATGLPVKLNVVVLKGMPESEIIEFVRLAERRELEVRFLEFMPLCGSGWQGDLFFPIAKVREVVEGHVELRELERNGHPAQVFAVNGGAGKVGFIAPLSEPFCETCSRIRISADGRIRPCLFSDYEVPMGHLLKNGSTDGDIAGALREAVANKPRGSKFRDDPLRDGTTDISDDAMGPFIRSIGG